MDEKIIKALRILSDRTASCGYSDAVNALSRDTIKPLKRVEDEEWEEIENILKGGK